MERLTKRIDGRLVFPTELIGVMMTPSNDTMCQILTRLAAYEDTGLEPEDIKKHEAAYNECLTRTYGPFKQKISQWLQAEQAGQLVALPCKVGDVIRFVSEDKQGYTRYEVISFNVDQGETFIVASCKPGSARLFSVNDIGKTVFLTREEAEAVLKGGED